MTIDTLPVVLLHGFAGHGDSWADVASALPGRPVDAVTLFGHDPEAPATSTIAFEEEVALVTERLAAFGRPVRLCGYSMGGRIALGVLARAPEHIESAVIIGAHPGLTSDVERRERRAADEVWAKLLEERGIHAFVEKWEAQPLFASQASDDPAALERQRAIRARHEPRSLAWAMRSLGLAAMPSYWEALERLEVPVTFVVGALDEKFTALALRMTERMKRTTAKLVRVDGAGHNVVLANPAFLAKIL